MKRIVPFGESPIDHYVKDFLRRKGVDPRDITGYDLRRSVDDPGTLVIEMPFLEVEVAGLKIGESGPELADLPPGARVTTSNPNIIKEG